MTPCKSVQPLILRTISYNELLSDPFSCRPTKWPFWFGWLLPFGAIYIFNWIMFILIMFSLVRHAAKSADTNTTSTRSVVLRHLFIAIVLSIMFGLGWAFGLIGTSDLPEEVYVPAQYIFSIFIGLQGVFIFFFHALRSTDAREEWKRWWFTITGRADEYRVLRTTSITGSGTGTRKKPVHRSTSTGSTGATSSSDSFRLASYTEKQPLDPNKEQYPGDIPMSIPLDTIMENPMALDEEGEMQEKEPTTPMATNVVALSIGSEEDREDADIDTKL